MLPKPLAVFDNGNFDGPAVDWVHDRTVDVKLSIAMMFVQQQSDDAVTYLLSGTSDGRMVVYGLLSKPGPDGPTPELIMPVVVKLPTPMESLQKASGAYIDGNFYWGWEETDPRNRTVGSSARFVGKRISPPSRGAISIRSTLPPCPTPATSKPISAKRINRSVMFCRRSTLRQTAT
jgi:hypothetical protein